MRTTLIATILLTTACLTVGGCPPAGDREVEGNPRARVVTSEGTFVFELFPDAAPQTVANFRKRVQRDFYDDTLFHEVIDGFVIIAGRYAAGLTVKDANDPIISEANNGLKNIRGAVAMVRDDPNDVDSATTQFFVNVSDNPAFNETLSTRGYAVFGLVVEGLSVIDKIAGVDTQTVGGLTNVPIEEVVIENITIEAGPKVVAEDWQEWEANAEYNGLRAGRSFLVEMLTWLIGG